MPRKSLGTPARQSASNKSTPMSRNNSSPASGRSLRQRSAQKQPSYVERQSSRESLSPSPEADSGSDEASGYGDDGASAEEDAESELDAGVSDEEGPPRKKVKGFKGSASAGPTPVGKKGSELWRTSVKTGLGPGREVIIDKPRARSPGDTPYRATEIHPNTLLFLSDLAANNDREWLKMHDPDYRVAWQDFVDFLEPLQERLMAIDETIPELPAKDVFFRIYRDVRFSPDPTPYKAHFSAAWSRTGRKGPFAAYYVQIKPGASFVGGGLWMPEARAVAALRRDIDRKPHKIKDVLLDARVRKQLLGGISADARKAVKGIAAQNAESALKKKPKDYPANHRDIELLRLKNFTLGKKLKDSEVLGPGAIERICEVAGALEPFVTYLNSVVMPDDPDAMSSSSSSSGGEGADEDDD